MFKRHPVAVAASLAGIFLVACLALETWFPSAVPVWPYRHENPYGTMGLMIAAVPLLTVWGVSVHIRCQDAKIRACYVGIAVALALWVIDALVKYSAESDGVIAVTWYLYYVPLVYVPLLQFFSAMRVTTLGRRPWAPRVKAVLIAAGAVLCALVLTNDIHHLAFVFDRSDPAWDVNYLYGPAYWAVFIWCVVLLALSLLIVVFNSRRTLRRALLFVACVFCLAVLYSFAYNQRMTHAFSSNFCISFVIACVVFCELSLDFGLLPSYVGMEELLHSLPIDVRILDEDENVVYRSDVAGEMDDALSRKVREAVASASDIASGDGVSFKMPDDPNTLYRLLRISGGHVLVAEDVSVIVRRQRELSARQEELSRSNAVLERMRASREEVYKSQAEQELCDNVEASLAETAAIIRDTLTSLPEGEDSVSVEQRHRGLTLVRLLVGYCKRKGALLISEGSDAEGMDFVLDEVCSDARASGIPCAATVNLTGPITASAANIVYDCVYDFVLTVFEHGDAVLVIYLGDGKEAGGAQLRVVLGTSDADTFRLPRTGQDVIGMSQIFGIPCRVEQDEDGVIFAVDIPPVATVPRNSRPDPHTAQQASMQAARQAAPQTPPQSSAHAKDEGVTGA